MDMYVSWNMFWELVNKEVPIRSFFSHYLADIWRAVLSLLVSADSCLTLLLKKVLIIDIDIWSEPLASQMFIVSVVELRTDQAFLHTLLLPLCALFSHMSGKRCKNHLKMWHVITFNQNYRSWQRSCSRKLREQFLNLTANECLFIPSVHLNPLPHPGHTCQFVKLYIIKI